MRTKTPDQPMFDADAEANARPIVREEPSALAASTGVSNPLVLLQSMLDRGCEPAALERMTALVERWRQNVAEQAYGDAMAAFQAECPVILKSRAVMNKNNSERYRFAGYDDVMKGVGPLLAKHKISVSFVSPTTDKRFDMTMRIRVGGYFEDKPYSAPMPDIAKIAGAMYMTEPQAFGLCLSYHKRYCLCNALNIVVSDTDGTDAQPEIRPLTSEQIKEINDLIESIRKAGLSFDMAAFLAWLEVENLGDVLQSKFAKVVHELKRKRGLAK